MRSCVPVELTRPRRTGSVNCSRVVVEAERRERAPGRLVELHLRRRRPSRRRTSMPARTYGRRNGSAPVGDLVLLAAQPRVEAGRVLRAEDHDLVLADRELRLDRDAEVAAPSRVAIGAPRQRGHGRCRRHRRSPPAPGAHGSCSQYSTRRGAASWSTLRRRPRAAASSRSPSGARPAPARPSRIARAGPGSCSASRARCACPRASARPASRC